MTTTPEPQDPLRKLLEVMATLRGVGGCPWDREQTHRSLVPYLIEEAYELIEAIETGSDDELREELGDVLLQVIFHAAIAEEVGKFSFLEVAQSLAEKLISRHPHVFDRSRPHIGTADQVRHTWHQSKMKSRSSALEGVAPGQPALQWAALVSARAASSGFEWESLGDVFEKVTEELEEFRRAAYAGEGEGEGDDAEMELGDLLFATVQLARMQKIDPEAALRRSVRKFTARFRRMEERLRTRGARADSHTLEQWRELWAYAKRTESH